MSGQTENSEYPQNSKKPRDHQSSLDLPQVLEVEPEQSHQQLHVEGKDGKHIDQIQRGVARRLLMAKLAINVCNKNLSQNSIVIAWKFDLF